LRTEEHPAGGSEAGVLYAIIEDMMPQLENSLRHVVKAHGHDVTTFNDAIQTQED
jgi:hypothetical protein